MFKKKVELMEDKIKKQNNKIIMLKKQRKYLINTILEKEKEILKLKMRKK